MFLALELDTTRKLKSVHKRILVLDTQSDFLHITCYMRLPSRSQSTIFFQKGIILQYFLRFRSSHRILVSAKMLRKISVFKVNFLLNNLLDCFYHCLNRQFFFTSRSSFRNNLPYLTFLAPEN